jgi:4-hydroxy-tetrahydrodipicolinate synthase
MAKTYSAIVHSLTPFDEKMRVDEAALRKHLRRLRDAGVGVYIGAAGAAEGYTLTREERETIVAVAVEELKGKVPVRAAGVEPRDTAEMVELLRSAERLKVDAAQIYSLDMGHGLVPNRKEIETYFMTAIEATSLPVIISNQQKVGYGLPLDLVEQLAARYPNLRGFAYDVGDTFYMIELIKRLGDRLEIHCSGTENALFTLSMGGNGYQGMEGNIAPRLAASVVGGFVAKDMDLMHESFRKLMQLRTILRGPVRSNQRAAKSLLNAYGLSGGHVRPPRLPVGPAELDEVIKAIQALKIPEMADWQLLRTGSSAGESR